MIKAIILTGGKGERLRPLTDKIPKVMVKIGGRPLLWYSIELLKRFGIKEIILLTGYLGKVIQEYFGNGKKFGVHISYKKESPGKLLGTAGAVGKLHKEIKSTFLVVYGDILRELDIKSLLNFHKRKKGLATICVYKNSNSNPKSIVTFDKNERIKSFVERPQGAKKNNIWSNASFYVFEQEIFKYILKNRPSDFGKDVFLKVLEDGQKMYAYKQTGYFLDVGSREKLEKAKADMDKIKSLFYL